MSVPKVRRNRSNIEFINTFNKLRKLTIDLLCRDFGIKAKRYTVHLLEDIYEINAEDTKELERICEQYGISSVDLDKYPEWLINGWRNEVMMILNNIGIEMHAANCLYIMNIQDFYTRRMHWNNCIGYCMALQDKLHEIIDIVRDVKLGSYQEIFELLTLEIKLLKGVRKSDNKVLKGLNDQLPYYNNGFVYNNYPVMPFIPNYCVNNGTVGYTQRRELCHYVAAPVVENTPVMKEMCKIVKKSEINNQSNLAAA